MLGTGYGREEGNGGIGTLFTFPNNLVYSSRTSCSRSETFGFEVRRRGFSGFVVGVVEEGSFGSGELNVDIIGFFVSLVD